MNSEQWQRVAAAFHRALELAPEERDGSLVAVFGDEPELLAEVQGLLASHDAAPDFLEQAAAEFAELTGEGSPLADPRRLGPYRVIERIGAGGMGTVYLAERDDDQYRQRVAIKLVKRGMDSERILVRFRAERQILASLDHPGIARLFDGGIAEDGRPYFVLEHIAEALPIDHYCREKKLNLRQRLELFCQACDAVEYAHRKLIIHRDLKPSNLLVSKDGRVKLLDFGIAKLLDPELAGVTRFAATHTEQRLLTPEYASPEQVRGEPLSTTSDVYSLGVLLYKMLTGSLPYRLTSRTSSALAAAICEQDPERPSTAIGWRPRPGDVAGGGAEPGAPPAGRLRGDLDNIVLKALRKEPEARYPSVGSLAADIGRFLDHRPVQARPQTAGYRVQRFLERHALASALSVLAGVLLIAGLAGTAWQARTAGQERDRARAEARKAARVADVLSDLFRLSAPGAEANAGTLTLRQFADQAEERALEGLENEPEVRSRLQTVMGGLNLDLARYETSRELYEAALETQRQLYPEGHADLAATLRGLAGLLVFQQELEAARGLFEEALAMRRRLEGDSLEVAVILGELAEPRALLGDVEGSERATLEAAEIRQRLLPGDHPLVGESLGRLAVLYYRRGEFDRAAGYGERALAIQRQVHGVVSQAVAHELNNLGAIYAANGDYRKALATHTQALAVRIEVYGPEHPYIAYSRGHLGRLSGLLGDTEGALVHLRRALEIREAAYGRRHRLVAQTMVALGSALSEAGDRGAADRVLEEAVAIQEDLLGEGLDLAEGLLALGRNRCAGGSCGDALPVLRRAIEVHRRSLGEDHPWTAGAATSLARALIARGRLVEAEATLESAKATLEERLPAGHLDIAPAYLLRGDLERERDRPEAARAAYEVALAILRGKLPSGHRRISEVEARLDSLAPATGRV